MWQFRAASRELMLAAALRWSTAAQHFFGAKHAKKQEAYLKSLARAMSGRFELSLSLHGACFGLPLPVPSAWSPSRPLLLVGHLHRRRGGTRSCVQDFQMEVSRSSNGTSFEPFKQLSV